MQPLNFNFKPQNTVTISALLLLISESFTSTCAFHVGYGSTAFGYGLHENIFRQNTNFNLNQRHYDSHPNSFSIASRQRKLELKMTFMDDDDEEIFWDDEEEHYNDINNKSHFRNDHDASSTSSSSSSSSSSLEQTRQMLEQMMSIQYDDDRSTKKKTLATGTGNDADPPSGLHASDMDAGPDCNIVTTATSTASSLHKVPNPTPTTETTTSSSSNSSTFNIVSFLQSNAPPALRLTDDLEQQRIQEIQLLSSLLHSNEAIAPLKALWMWERGSIAQKTLSRAMELVSVQSYGEAEELFISLVLEEHEEGFHWVEPVHGLATLYYMQGRYEDAKSLLDMVLEVKPWHLDALSSMILVCTITNDVQKAQFWSRRGMPPLKNPLAAHQEEDGAEKKDEEEGNDTRFEWVKEMMGIARINLYNDSRVGRSVYVGQEGRIVRNFRKELEHKLRKERQDEQQQQQQKQHDHESSVAVVDAWQ